MKRHLAAACILAPAAIIATAMPAQAASPQLSAARVSASHINSVAVVVTKGAAPLKALRSSTQKCGGVLEGRQLIADPKTKKVVAELDVYATPANGVTAIACLRHAGITAHVRTQTSVTIAGFKSQADIKSGKPVVAVQAHGNFISYAGPVAIGGLKGKHCVAVTGSIKAGGHTVLVPLKVYCATK